MALNESKLYMWRTIVSLSHADAVLHPSEENFLVDLFGSVQGLSADQVKVLKSDLVNPQDSKEMYNGITEPADRAQLFYYARMLAWADGDFCSNEEVIFEKLRTLTLDQVDFNAVMAKVNKMSEDFKAKQEAQREARPLHRRIIDAIVFWEDLP